MDAAKQQYLEFQDEQPSVDTDKLSYEIFTILESKFLFGSDDETKLPPECPLAPPPREASSASAAATMTAASPSERGKVCILSIDGGGGMRGILPARALVCLEEFLRSKSGDPDACIADFFDVAAGTGIGGIFALMLFSSRDGATPIFRPDDALRLLGDKGHHFFLNNKCRGGAARRRLLRGAFCRGGDKLAKQSSTAAATSAMEREMKDAFGEDLTLRNTLKPVLIPCYDLRSGAPFLFSRADALEKDGFDFRLWEVSRATWAEPGRFEPIRMRSMDGSTRCVGVDGGLAASNPAAAAITHVLHNKQEFPQVRGIEDLRVLSLGCGGGVSLGCGDWTCYEQVRRWKVRDWARPIARISSDGSADLVDHAVALAFGHIPSADYVRIQANASSFHPDVDSDAGPENVKMLLEAAEEMLRQRNVESVLFGGKRIGEQTNLEKLDWFAGELVRERQMRRHRVPPIVAFKQAISPNKEVVSSGSPRDIRRKDRDS